MLAASRSSLSAADSLQSASARSRAQCRTALRGAGDRHGPRSRLHRHRLPCSTAARLPRPARRAGTELGPRHLGDRREPSGRKRSVITVMLGCRANPLARTTRSGRRGQAGVVPELTSGSMRALTEHIARRSSLETCICEQPSRAAMSVCVMSYSMRSVYAWRPRHGSRKMAPASVRLTSTSSNRSSASPKLSATDCGSATSVPGVGASNDSE